MANFRIAFIIFLLFSALSYPSYSTPRTCKATIINWAGTHIAVNVEIADTEELRSTGLMHRAHLGANDGMLFVFGREQMLSFWMKNTSIPLSIAYIGADGMIHQILDMRPFNSSVTYPSARPALYALEMNRGWFEKNNISEGCRLSLNGCISK